jgi:MFS family permease
MTTEKAGSIWSQTFAFLCLAQLLAYAHNALLTPTLPLYVTHLGGSPFMVGLVLAVFAATSVVFRPAIGSWADTWSEAGVLAAGSVLMSASVLLFLVPLPEIFMVANALRGIGWAGINTGGYALLALTAPVERRGEASGYYSGLQASASILFPAMALWLINAPFGGFRSVIMLSATLATAAAALSLVLRRCGPTGVAGQVSESPTKLTLNPLASIEREVLLPSALLFCLNLAYPAIGGFIVLYAATLGIENIGWYFVASGATSLVARPALGRVADRIGYGPSLATGFVCETWALLLLSLASSLGVIVLSGVLFAFGNAIASSTILALAIQRAHPQRRGKAMASFSVAYPLAAGVGALLTGSVVELAGYFAMYLMAAGLVAAGLVVTLACWSNLRNEHG